MKRTSRDIRTANRYGVLRHIVAESPVSRQELAAATGLSLATVANLVGELLELGLLIEVGYEDSDGGRPRGLVAVNAEGGALIGVDVAETYIHVELYDLSLAVIARAEEELRPGEREPSQVLAHIVSAVSCVVAEAGIPADRVLGVGVSMPGMVDREGGVSVFAPNWDWHDVPLLSLLAEHIPYPLYLDNPLRACTVAELWFGAARGCDDVVVVNLGTGVGAGIALGGALHRGVTNSAGEWGHTTLVLDGRLCHCGNHGCVETYVGAPGIMQNLRELAPESPLLHPDDQTATIDALARGVTMRRPCRGEGGPRHRALSGRRRGRPGQPPQPRGDRPEQLGGPQTRPATAGRGPRSGRTARAAAPAGEHRDRAVPDRVQPRESRRGDLRPRRFPRVGGTEVPETGAPRQHRGSHSSKDPQHTFLNSGRPRDGPARPVGRCRIVRST